MSKQILVIEDDVALRNLFSNVVSAMDCTVYEASSRAESIELLGETEMDLVICDIEVEDGIMLDVIGICCSHELDVVVITANEDYLSACKDMDVLAFILKPIAPSDLMTVVSDIRQLDLPNAYFAPRARG